MAQQFPFTKIQTELQLWTKYQEKCKPKQHAQLESEILCL